SPLLIIPVTSIQVLANFMVDLDLVWVNFFSGDSISFSLFLNIFTSLTENILLILNIALIGMSSLPSIKIFKLTYAPCASSHIRVFQLTVSAKNVQKNGYLQDG
ncbi:MAG: hypothetical protein K0Q85_1102, partial [Caproiciproducens sp.]|nr:hypothetical protein [Caproiciproducens sp.]